MDKNEKKETYEITPQITVSGVSEQEAKNIADAVSSAATASSTHISDWKTRHIWGD